MAELFLTGIGQVCSPQMIGLILGGVILGIIFGAIPGLTTSMGILLVLPVTYSMDLYHAMALFMGMYIGGVSGGLITAILLNIPGTPASVPTTFDGYPMAQKGQAGKALSVGIVYSFLGGTFSMLVLFFVAPLMSEFALKFGNIEYFSVCLFALMLVASLSGKSLLKGIMAALLGILFTTVGMAPLDGMHRYTFGFQSLNAGFQLVAVLIGIYAVVEVLKVAETRKAPQMVQSDYHMKGFDITKKEMKSQTGNFLCSAVVGTGIGFLPGIGQGAASMLAYGFCKNRSKYPEKYGTGIIDGVVASETANNAVIGGAMIPLLTMGIPGDATTAILLAAFMLKGVTPGPLLFTTHADLIYTIFVCLIVANVGMLLIESKALPLFLKVLKVPKYVLLPIILVLCSVGAFGINNRVFDVGSILIFSLVGYGFYKFKFPLAPFMMGFVLGPLVETHLQRGLMLSYGSIIPFFTSPISAFFLLATAVYLFFVIRGRMKKRV